MSASLTRLPVLVWFNDSLYIWPQVIPMCPTRLGRNGEGEEWGRCLFYWFIHHQTSDMCHHSQNSPKTPFVSRLSQSMKTNTRCGSDCTLARYKSNDEVFHLHLHCPSWYFHDLSTLFPWTRQVFTQIMIFQAVRGGVSPCSVPPRDCQVHLMLILS